jgi:hypothetical protein
MSLINSALTSKPSTIPAKLETLEPKKNNTFIFTGRHTFECFETIDQILTLVKK